MGAPLFMDHRRGAVGSQYTPEFGEEICRRLREGQTVRQITADPDMPSYATLFRWRKMNPDFAKLYDDTREAIAADKLRRRDEIETWKPYWRAHKAKLGLGRGWVSGRGGTYRADWAEAFCRRIEDGATVAAVTAEPHMPSVKAVYGWLRRHPEFRARYQKALTSRRRRLEFQIDLVVDSVSDIGGVEELRAAKRAVERLEGRIGRLTPKTYRIRSPHFGSR